MDMSYESITVEQALWHNFYFGSDIVCDGDSKEIDYQDYE